LRSALVKMTTALTTIKELHAMQKDINVGKLIVLQKGE
jgi:hypothetical protein